MKKAAKKRSVVSHMRFPRKGDGSRPHIGAAPGMDFTHLLPHLQVPPHVTITCIDYGPTIVRRTKIDDLEAFLSAPRPTDISVRWVNVEGLNDSVVQKFASHYKIHALFADDIVHRPQRPKFDIQSDQLFFVFRELRLIDHDLHNEQVSLLLKEGTLLTFQESQGDLWDAIRNRIDQSCSRLRSNGSSFLAYSLLDAIVDHYFPILENYGERLESIEESFGEKTPSTFNQRIHVMRRELLVLRRALWPMRDLIAAFLREDHPLIEATTKTYLRDVYDHCVQVIDVMETYRDLCAELQDLYLSSISYHTNEVMKVLTMLSSIFIPITFLAGVYGMNFEVLPELKWSYGYVLFWVACVAVGLFQFYMFRRKKWI